MVRGLRLLLMPMLAMALAGCGGTVPLLTDAGRTGCFLSFAVGELVTDPTHGTAIVETRDGTNYTYPVMWPAGYTGRGSIGGVEVLDASGNVVARTGSRLKLLGGYSGESPRVWSTCEGGVYPPQ